MPKHGELQIGFAGLALLRNWLVGEREAADRALAEIPHILAGADFGRWEEIPERSVEEGYAAWSETYDSPLNPLFAIEAPVMRAVLEALAPGNAIDAACGTGRQTSLLRDLGHAVVGIDPSVAMLDQARAKLTGVECREGARDGLPVETGSADLAVCALALTHTDDLDVAIGELARVVRPGGRVVISDLHPVLVSLSAQAAFTGADGRRAFVRNRVHWHGQYLSAFRAAGLTVEVCEEPPYPIEQVLLWAGAHDVSNATIAEAVSGLPAILLWVLSKES